MFSRTWAAGYLFTAQSANNNSGSALDMRGAWPAAFFQFGSISASAVLTIQASHDLTAWNNVLTVTATTGAGGLATTGTAQISAYYPFVRGQITAYSGGGNTATVWAFYAGAVV